MSTMPMSIPSGGGGGGLLGIGSPGGGGQSGLNTTAVNPSQGIPGYSAPTGDVFSISGTNPYGTVPGYNGSGNSGTFGITNNSSMALNPKAFSKPYGKALGDFVSNYVQTGSGFNPAALQTMFNSMIPQEARALSTIDSASGVSGTRFSSAHDFATEDYLAQIYGIQGKMASEEYDQSQSRLMSLIEGGMKGNLGMSQGPGIMDYANMAAQVAMMFASGG